MSNAYNQLRIGKSILKISLCIEDYNLSYSGMFQASTINTF